MIKIGTCGFSFRDWKGTVYPEKIRNQDLLHYYHRNLGFDTLEIDVSYYRMLPWKTTDSWAKRTDESFLFAVKCHKDMTLNEMGDINPQNVDNEPVFRHFVQSFNPIAESGKLLTFLAQFGPLFRKNRNNIEYLANFRERMGEAPLTIEFRHKSWLDGENRDETFDILKNLNLGYAVVDEPRIRSLAPFVARSTTDTAYIRLHGRNEKEWFGGDGHSRYDYFYSDDELTEFIPIIRELEGRTRITGVFFNNCHAGAALKNAVKLKQMLSLARAESENLFKGGQLNLPF